MFRGLALTLACLLGLLVPAGAAPARRGEALLVSQAGGDSPSISADGRFVAFTSPADTFTYVYVRDLLAKTTAVVSQTTSGVGANADAADPSISADGRFVAFSSPADNLSSGDDNTFSNIFVRDTQANTTTLVSQAGSGVGADGFSFRPAISADGRFVAFESTADNLSTGDDDDLTNVFVRDLQANTTTLASQSSTGVGGDGNSAAASISADGRFVAFTSRAGNFSGLEDDDFFNVFVHDMQAGTTTLASQTGGVGANADAVDPSLSGDGRFVAFTSIADNLTSGDGSFVDVFVRDLRANTTTLVSQAGGVGANARSVSPSVSADGRLVAFVSDADNLSTGDDNDFSNVFVRDIEANTTTLASHDDGIAGDGDSEVASISADGRFVAFESAADNLSSGDDDAVGNVFRQDLVGPPPECSDLTQTVSRGGVATVSLTCRDDDGDPITRAVVRGPAHGKLGPVEQAEGTVSYTPDPGYTGADSFSFHASDASGSSAPASVSLTVTAAQRGAFGARARVTLSLGRARVPARGPVAVRVSNANDFAVDGRLSARTATRVTLKAKRFKVAANATRTVRLSLPKSVRRTLQRRPKLALRVTATVRDPAGNRRKVTRKLSVRSRRGPMAAGRT